MSANEDRPIKIALVSAFDYAFHGGVTNHIHELAAQFERWGYPVWLRLAVGAIETAGGALLVIPWVATWAGLAVATVMVGAGVTRMMDGRWVDVAWIAVYLAGCLWIAWEWRSLRLLRRDPS